MEKKQSDPDRDGLRAATFRKSTYSSGAQECVAVGFANGWAGVLDTKQSAVAANVLVAVPVSQFTRFLSDLKTGRFAA